MLTEVDDLVGAAEIQRMLGGISRQRVHTLVNRDDFPAPAYTFAMGKAWRTDEVRAWATAHGRTIAEDDDNPSG